MTKITLGVFLLVLSHCGDGSGVGVDAKKDTPLNGPGFPDEEVTVGDPIGSNGTIFSERRLLSFDQESGQAAVLNPDTGKALIQQTGLKDALYVIPLDEFRGLLVIRKDTFELPGQAPYPWQQSVADFAVASNTVGMVAVDPEGTTLTYFDRSTFTIKEQALSWSTENSPEASAEAPTVRPALFYDEDGTTLAVVDLLTGDYSVFRFNGGRLQKESVVGPCPGLGAKADGSFRLRAGSFSLAADALLLGDDSGNLFRIGLAACDDYSSQINLGGNAILKISPGSDGNVFVAQQNIIRQVSREGESLTVSKTQAIACHHPTSVTAIGADQAHLAVTCLTPSNYDPATEDPPLLVEYATVNLQVYPRGSAELTASYAIASAAVTGQGLVSETGRLHVVYKGVFGRMETIDLLTGATETRNNVLIDDILE